MKRKTVVTLIILAILLLSAIGVAIYIGVDCSSSDNETPPSSEQPGDDLIGDELPDYMMTFEGSLSFELKQEHEVFYPTFDGKLTASFIPDSFYLNFNEQKLTFPQDGYVFMQYGEVYEITFSSKMLYDYISAGEYVATLYAFYEKENKMFKVNETPVTIESNLYKADYLTFEDKPLVAMYSEDIVNESNFRTNFVLENEEGFMYPTITMFTYLSKKPTMVELTLHEEVKKFYISELNVISHNTYYELSFNKVVIFNSIPKGENELTIKVYVGDVAVREKKITFTSKHDYYASNATDINTGESGGFMDSNDFWIGPY